MKKIALILALVMTVGVLAACGSEPAETTKPIETTLPQTVLPTDTIPADTTLPADTTPAETEPEFTMSATEELIYKIYETAPVELMLMTMPLDLADGESLKRNAGLESTEGVLEVAISEPMIGSQAYSMVVVKCESPEKAAEVAQTMYDNIDMAKWVCVMADQKQAVVSGDTAMFCMIMTDLGTEIGVDCDKLVEGFTTAVGGTVDKVIK